VETRQVVVSDSLHLARFPGLLDPRTEVTDERGLALFTELFDVAHRLTAEADGYVGRAGIEVRPGDMTRVTLRRGRTLEGHIKDGVTGEPIEGAVVRARSVDWNRQEDSQVVTVTDQAGVFRLAGLPDDATALTVKAPWYPSSRIELDPAVSSPVLFLHGSTRGVRGRVVDTVSGEPLPGVRVACDGADTVSHEDGTFVLTGFPVVEQPDGATVKLMFEGEAVVDSSLSVDLPLEVEDDEVAAVELGDVAMARRRGLSGTVLSPAGKPVEGALVVLAPAGTNITLPGVLRACTRVASGPDGRFSFSARPCPRGPLHLMVLSPGLAVAARTLQETEEDVVVRLETGFALDVDVDPGVSRIVVEEFSPDNAEGPRSTVRRRGVRVGQDGQVRVQGVRSGFVRVRVAGRAAVETHLAGDEETGFSLESEAS